MLPLVDFTRFRHEGADPEAVATLRKACTGPGFFYATGHGVPPELLRDLEAATRTFFALPDDQKAQIAMARGGRAWRGSFPVGGELTSGVPDMKEGLYFGDELAGDDPRVLAGWPLHGANLFPAQVPELKPLVLETMRALADTGQLVLSAMACSLEVPTDFFSSSLTRRPLSLFRIFHYPAPTTGQEQAFGVGEHTDYGLLTLLAQDDCGGLEVKTAQGWVDAPPIPGSFVCNLGDMLDRLTGGLYRSTPHRVRNRAGKSRYSWPFFFDPGFDAEVKPLPLARVRPIEKDAAERWDRASVHELRGTYGEYLLGKVSKVFPTLAKELP